MQSLAWCVEHRGATGYRVEEWFETELEAMAHAWWIESNDLGEGEVVRVLQVRREVAGEREVTCAA